MMPSSSRTPAYLALGIICIVWGTTYTVIKFAIPHFPSLMLVGIRQTLAGVIMLLIAWASGLFRKGPALTRKYILLQAITGLATITGGNGFVTWGMKYVSSGIAAIIGALTPVVVLLINYIWHKRGEKFSPYTIAGVALGFVGLGVIFNNGWDDFLKPEYRWGIAACFASCFTWSLGTVMAKRFNEPGYSPLLNGGLQVTAGGLGGFLASAIVDPNHTIHHTWEGWLSVLYLALIGTALAFTLYMFVLKRVSATAASIYTYINPMVAVFLGWAYLGETITFPELLGMSVTLMGVWLVNQGESQLYLRK